MRSNSIVLVNVHKKSDNNTYNNPTEHLGLAYLTAYLRHQGYTGVRIIDGYALSLSTEEIFTELFEAPPELLGITLEYNTFGEAVRLAQLVKSAFPSTHIVLGGEHATYAGETILKEHPEIDFIIRGEGELTLVELCEHLFVSSLPLDDIAGLAYRCSQVGSFRQNQDRPAIENLNTLPFPARDTLERALSLGLRPAISMLGSRGCPAKCSFCNAHKFFNIGGGAGWRPRSPENIIEELSALLEKYHNYDIYPVVYFGDENFVGPRSGLQRVRRFAELILEKNILFEYEIFCRTDSFYGEQELVGLLARSGLISVLMGIEAGSDEQLKSLKKGSSANKNFSSVQLFQQNNITTSSSGFLMFNPYTTFLDLRKNVKFLLKIQHATLYNMSCRVHAYPGLDMNRDLQKKGMFESDYTHFKVDSISFVDNRVQRLAEYLSEEVDLGLLRREDSTMRDIDINMARLFNIEGFQLDRGSEYTKFNVDCLYSHKKQVQNLTANFFLKLVGQAEVNTLSLESFRYAYAEYSKVMNDQMGLLDQAFGNVMRQMHDALVNSEDFGARVIPHSSTECS